MPDLMYAPAPLLDGLKTWAASVLPATVSDGDVPHPLSVHVDTVPPDVTAPFVLLSLAPGTTRAPVGQGWDQQGTLVIQGLCEGRTTAQTRALADLLRWRISGRSRRGAHVTAMTLHADVAVMDRRSDDDGLLDFPGGRPQWTETFRIDYQRS